MKSGRLYLVTLLWALLLCLAGAARAHDPRLSGMRILLEKGQTTVEVTTYAASLAAAEHKNELTPWEIDLAFRKRVCLRFAGKDFQPTSSRVHMDEERGVIIWRAIHPGAGAAPDVVRGLYPEDPMSRCVVTIVRSGDTQKEIILDGQHSFQNDNAEKLPDSLRFLKEGFRHIFGGLDHICFVLGLVLLGGGLRVLFKTVTLFTLAHSITLAIAVFGLLRPAPRLVEPLIALSIIAVAVENLRPQKGGDTRHCWQPYYAFGFGLVHGFGFAGGLVDMGLPRQALGPTLLFFNMGVELGQATLLLVSVPILTWLRSHKPRLALQLARICAVGIGIAGAGWLVIRLFAG